MSIVKLPAFLKNIIRPAYYYYQRKRLAAYRILYKKEDINFYTIPVIINNYNRLTFLLQLIEALQKRGYTNIHIIDNASTFPPLLTYYKTCPYKVHRLSENLGYLALWKSSIYKQFINDYYVYTDSDIVPVEECPEDFMKVFWEKLNANDSTVKVGFSLKIDDLPNHYRLKQSVIEHEMLNNRKKDLDAFYEANIDTTFALYRPGAKGGANLYQKMYRSVFPYEARHMPWYVDSEKPGEEELFYLKSIQQSTHWSSLSQQAT